MKRVVLLILGFIYAVDATLEFIPDAELVETLKGVEETDEQDPTPFAPIKLGTLMCKEGDSYDTEITKVEDGSSFIRISPTGRYFTTVTLTQPLDYEDVSEDLDQVNTKKVSIRCRSKVDNKNTILYENTLVVKDINDKVPVFDRSTETYRTQITEFLDNPNGRLLIYTRNSSNPIRVLDQDGSANNNLVTAKCVNMTTKRNSVKRPCDGYFSVEAIAEGFGIYYFNIYALRDDYSGEESYQLEIQAINEPRLPTEPTLESLTQNVNILIQDIQNLNPIIDKNSLNFEMPENLEVGSILAGYIVAHDADVGDPHPVRFEITAPNDQLDMYAFNNDLFSLGQVTEDPTRPNYYRVPVVVKNPVDREAIPDRTKTLYLGIKAIEYDPQNRPNREKGTAQETFTIQVSDLNDRTPTFSESIYNINVTELTSQDANPENFRQISNNIDINVEDTDSTEFQRFTVNIVSGNNAGNFKLDKNEGSGLERFSLYAKQKILDHEVLPNSYVLQLRAVDTNQTFRTSEATVIVTILEANDHSPEFQKDTEVFNIREDHPVDREIGSVVATDRDSEEFGQIVQYRIIGDESDTFDISINGVITLKKPLDYEKRDSYFFTVVAYDGGVGNNQREGSININVEVLNVIDVGPEFSAIYTSTLREESFTLIPEIRVQAQSREAVSEPISYSIVSVIPSTLNNAFSINSVNGTLSVTRFINYKETPTNRPGIVRVNISAEAGGLYAYTIATISITDINNYAPEFVPVVPNNTYQVTIPEITNPEDNVIDLDVIDRDGNDTDNGRVTFQITRGAYDDFMITLDSGIIKVTPEANLDRDNNQQSYTIVVLARDKGNPPESASATVVITLIDSNNKNPEFAEPLYRFQVNADAPINSLIGSVSATDPDSESSLNYSIDFNSVVFERQAVRLQDYIDARTVLKIEPLSGEIKVAGQIRRDKYDRINMNVIVEDVNIDTTVQARQTASASVVIFILAAVDPRIYFTNVGWDRVDQTITITKTETKAQVLAILTLQAVDPEIPASINIFRKVQSSDPQDYFEINSTNVFIKKPLDYEALPVGQKFVSVVVEAVSDDSTKVATATIVVKVQDLNDNAPVFEKTNYVFTIAEDKKSPSIVGRVKATDVDSASYSLITYNLIQAENDFGIYTEGPGRDMEAIIYVTENANLDYETKPVYNLVLQAADNGGSADAKYVTNVNVEIQLSDVNDVSPRFAESVYNISIVGTKEVGGDVFFIRAEDEDAGINGQVDYFIVRSTNNGTTFFGIDTIDQTTDILGETLQVGRIFVRSSLESLPDRAMFELTVNARDRGYPPTQPGSCKVIITVSKGVQDLKPKWDEQLSARVQIQEGLPRNTFVSKVLAYPADVTSSIVYSFVRAGDALRDYDSFNINPATGEITTKVVLDYEQQKIYNLLILATDSVNNTLTNQYLLIVQVTDVDDNQPSFAACPGRVYSVPETANVNEEQPPAVNVYRAQACDLDDPPLNLVRYSWFIDNNLCPAENLNVFSLNEDNGQVSTKIPLDREAVSEYTLCIEASRPDIQNTERDLQSLNQTNKLLFLEVTVNDVNDLGPKFREPVVKTVILQYPAADIAVAEAYDEDLPPNDGIRYSIENIDFTINKKTMNAPTAFTINANDGSIVIGISDYSDYVGGFFDITVKAEDYNGAPVPHDNQLHRVYVTDRAHRIRVVFNEPADAGVDRKAKNMINELNDRFEDSGMYFETESISYHVVSSNADPSFAKTDMCLVVVENDEVLSGVSATSRLTDSQTIQGILEKYGAVDPGSCDPAVSMYPVGWESYWWVLVAFAIFIFVCCLILILLICVLYRQYRQYMDSRKTYLVPGN